MPVRKFATCSGHLALDFANTVSARHTRSPIERLPSYDQLVELAVQTDICTPATARRLRALARRQPARAKTTLAGAIELREALYAIAACSAHHRSPRRKDLAVVTANAHRLALDHHLAWRWQPGGLDAVLGPIVLAALALLTSPLRERIRVCEADDCVWVFLDTSKNRSRRWCDMKQCGNRCKARRFYRRHRRR